MLMLASPHVPLFLPSLFRYAAQVVDSCMHVLRTNFKGDKPVHVLLAGAVACLKHLLFDYGRLFSPAPAPAGAAAPPQKRGHVDKLRELFELVFEHGIVMYAEMKQYHVTRESLQLVAAHAGLFRSILVSE